MGNRDTTRGELVFAQDSALGRMLLRPLGRYILPDGRVVHPGIATSHAIQEDERAVASRLVAKRLVRSD